MPPTGTALSVDHLCRKGTVYYDGAEADGVVVQAQCMVVIIQLEAPTRNPRCETRETESTSSRQVVHSFIRLYNYCWRDTLFYERWVKNACRVDASQNLLAVFLARALTLPSRKLNIHNHALLFPPLFPTYSRTAVRILSTYDLSCPANTG
jgi:hypothetical protein